MLFPNRSFYQMLPTILCTQLGDIRSRSTLPPLFNNNKEKGDAPWPSFYTFDTCLFFIITGREIAKVEAHDLLTYENQILLKPMNISIQKICELLRRTSCTYMAHAGMRRIVIGNSVCLNVGIRPVLFECRDQTSDETSEYSNVLISNTEPSEKQFGALLGSVGFCCKFRATSRSR